MVRREQNIVTRQISMTTRKELVEALRVRYGSAPFVERIRILDEFVALTGYHRKHAIRILRDEVTKANAARARNRLYDEAVRQALTMLWEAADRVCGKRLKALIPLLFDVMSVADLAESFFPWQGLDLQCALARQADRIFASCDHEQRWGALRTVQHADQSRSSICSETLCPQLDGRSRSCADESVPSSDCLSGGPRSSPDSSSSRHCHWHPVER